MHQRHERARSEHARTRKLRRLTPRSLHRSPSALIPPSTATKQGEISFFSWQLSLVLILVGVTTTVSLLSLVGGQTVFQAVFQAIFQPITTLFLALPPRFLSVKGEGGSLLIVLGVLLALSCLIPGFLPGKARTVLAFANRSPDAYEQQSASMLPAERAAISSASSPPSPISEQRAAAAGTPVLPPPPPRSSSQSGARISQTGRIPWTTTPPPRRMIGGLTLLILVVIGGGIFFSTAIMPTMALTTTPDLPDMPTMPADPPPSPAHQTAHSQPDGGHAVVGELTFGSSGQLDPRSSAGSNDTVNVTITPLTPPPAGQQALAWLLPDHDGDEQHAPLLLGTLKANGHLTYTAPTHQDILATYSRFLVTNETQPPLLPTLDQQHWQYQGTISTTPSPTDHLSLLDHLRHLLASDPTLEHNGLSGGLLIWLNRNSEKILEWAGAARDGWAGGQQTTLIHRQVLRILEYLDGVASVKSTGDVPADAPILVDPTAGRIGLLQTQPPSVLPAFLSHVALHLQGLAHAPGATAAQQRLAQTLITALTTDTTLLKTVHHDAVLLTQMTDTHLRSPAALTLLNDMVTQATTAYTGQVDPVQGNTVGGLVSMGQAVQGVAAIPITTVSH
ncbi:hypothetical protein [Dictyobacter arantiisoli]|uniref:Uncharacterized protein n=1 Tax=Dictyobacter arantiisoli TaxID=2014874 RepID=A0A5A5TJP4_9CHLR|nr:hypothetical protein [Dictyobacter arantiisoli]GCF11243.1 hypothetical protein KDI_48070 [Dictyobacter arantiisoli]